MEKIKNSFKNPFVKLTIVMAGFFALSWVWFGLDFTFYIISIATSFWWEAIKQMNYLFIGFTLVVGLITLLWALNIKNKSLARLTKLTKKYDALALVVFACIAALLFALAFIL